jgi:PleD family two-component response regulator
MLWGCNNAPKHRAARKVHRTDSTPKHKCVRNGELMTNTSSIQGETRPASRTGSARLLLADDHDLVREGIRAVLEGEPDLLVVGEAANGREAVELCKELRPDLVLMDVRMPEMDGLAATRAVKEDLPVYGMQDTAFCILR